MCIPDLAVLADYPIDYRYPIFCKVDTVDISTQYLLNIYSGPRHGRGDHQRLLPRGPRVSAPQPGAGRGAPVTPGSILCTFCD